MAVRIRWTFTVDAERVAALVPDGADPAEVVDALLAAADRDAGTTLGTRWRVLADGLGDALDALPRRPLSPPEVEDARGRLGPFRPEPAPVPEQRRSCAACGSSTPVYTAVAAR